MGATGRNPLRTDAGVLTFELVIERAELRVYRQADGAYKAFATVHAGQPPARRDAEAVAATAWEAVAEAIRRASA